MAPHSRLRVRCCRQNRRTSLVLSTFRSDVKSVTRRECLRSKLLQQNFAATSVEEKKILSGSTIETIVLGTLTQDFAFEQERLVTSKNAASHVSRYELASSN